MTRDPAKDETDRRADALSDAQKRLQVSDRDPSYGFNSAG